MNIKVISSPGLAASFCTTDKLRPIRGRSQLFDIKRMASTPGYQLKTGKTHLERCGTQFNNYSFSGIGLICPTAPQPHPRSRSNLQGCNRVLIPHLISWLLPWLKSPSTRAMYARHTDYRTGCPNQSCHRP